MKQLDEMSTATGVKQFIRPETVEVTERAAYDMLKELQELALKDGGLIAVTGIGIAAGEAIDPIVEQCAREGMDESMTRAVAAGYLLTSWLPAAIKHLKARAV